MTNKPTWEVEFREYFDKNLKPKKAGIKNLDREILVNFISTKLAEQKQEITEQITNYFKNMLENLDQKK